MVSVMAWRRKGACVRSGMVDWVCLPRPIGGAGWDGMVGWCFVPRFSNRFDFCSVASIGGYEEIQPVIYVTALKRGNCSCLAGVRGTGVIQQIAGLRLP